MQCTKLRVHIVISTAGCIILGGVYPGCACFLSHLLLLHIGRVHGAISGCTVLWEVHPASAHNKSLISDTVMIVLLTFSACLTASPGWNLMVCVILSLLLK